MLAWPAAFATCLSLSLARPSQQTDIWAAQTTIGSQAKENTNQGLTELPRSQPSKLKMVVNAKKDVCRHSIISLHGHKEWNELFVFSRMGPQTSRVPSPSPINAV